MIMASKREKVLKCHVKKKQSANKTEEKMNKGQVI